MNQKKPTIIEQLAFLAVKHDVYVSELFHTLVLARKSEKSTCMELAVQYRGSIKGRAIFLITKDGKVIVQFRIPEDFLLKTSICFEAWMNTDKIRKQMFKQDLGYSLSTMVQDLRHGMKRINVEAIVLDNPKPSTVYTRFGNSAMVTNVWIADESGKIKLCLWNDQATAIAKGDNIQIKSASVSEFRGERQLCLGRTGSIGVLQRQDAMLEKELELITEN